VSKTRVHQGGRHKPLGRNEWGNLYRHVVLRTDPRIVGFVISDLGEYQIVADAEDGWPLVGPTAQWVGVGSPAHIAALDEEGT
jgi:hypothetical protein